MMEFARALKETRQRKGWKQAEMAEKLGISRASMSLYETGKQTPGLDVLDALHTVTGAPLDYLMGYTDNYTVETLGIDNELGLSTETINRLKNDELVQTAINYLIESSLLHEWVDAVTKYHDLCIIAEERSLPWIDMANDGELIHNRPKGEYYGVNFSIKMEIAELYAKIGKVAASIFEGKPNEQCMQESITVKHDIDYALQALLAQMEDGPDKEKMKKIAQEYLNDEKEV